MILLTLPMMIFASDGATFEMKWDITQDGVDPDGYPNLDDEKGRQECGPFGEE